MTYQPQVKTPAGPHPTPPPSFWYICSQPPRPSIYRSETAGELTSRRNLLASKFLFHPVKPEPLSHTQFHSEETLVFLIVLLKGTSAFVEVYFLLIPGCLCQSWSNKDNLWQELASKLWGLCIFPLMGEMTLEFRFAYMDLYAQIVKIASLWSWPFIGKLC